MNNIEELSFLATNSYTAAMIFVHKTSNFMYSPQNCAVILPG